MARSLESGTIDATGLDARIAAIGRTEFEEARAVLTQDGLLLPPVSDASAYPVFAAVFLELTYFEPSSRAMVFPAIESPDSIEAVLTRDVQREGAPRRRAAARRARVSRRGRSKPR